MTYVPPEYPTDIPSHSTDGDDLPPRYDDLDDASAADHNNIRLELCASLSELGTLPKGTFGSVSARLAAQALALYDTTPNIVITCTAGYPEIKQPILLTGSGRVKNHLVLPAKSLKQPGLKPATFGLEGICITLDFVHTAEKDSYAQSHIPFRWDPSTDIDLSIDWFVDGDCSTSDVLWGIEYILIKSGETVAGSTATISQAFTGTTAGLLIRSTFTTKILSGVIENMDDLNIRLFRDPTDEADTYGAVARFVSFHLHFVTNKLGGTI